ncbi:transcriptional regulator, LysR family [delta proteobacterium NaphS2]|nr:transcriptional regulator, LysR family [delta proteobacterium NaphS2]
MISRRLEAFIAVAESGSFSKAAKIIYVSPTAIMKQINALEDETGLCLFSRTFKGLTLTGSGRSLYEDVRLIVKYSEEAVKRAHKTEKCIHVGTSILRSGNYLKELWSKVSALEPNFKIRMIPFEDTFQNFMATLKDLGQNIDVIAAIYPLKRWNCSNLKLAMLPICCAVSRKHRLATKKRLCIEDLYGEKLIMIRRGVTSHIDALHDEIEQKHPKIEVFEAPYYDLGTFNQCEATNCVLISSEIWAEVHPLLITIPVDWKFFLPYGLIYPRNPSDTVLQFIDVVRTIMDLSAVP